jgi:(5-formylfuran-3-yl)methyl phosphate synthase
MTGMLASVTNIEEALIALEAEVDIIDLKQPSQGALGALKTDLVRQIVRRIDGQRPVSATIGDLPMSPDLIYDAVNTMATTQVDYIKIGFFLNGDWPATITGLSELTDLGIRLIAVLFADAQPDFGIIASLAEAGFSGVMLDTQEKHHGSLLTHLTTTEIGNFINSAKTHYLLCGLAGSLALQDIPVLLPYNPDYLGFRGALCKQHIRTEQLDTNAIRNIKQAVALPVADCYC